MTVLLTGANGFLGNYIKKAFKDHSLVTLSLSGCTYNIDLSCTIPDFSEPIDKVIHAAGLAHITAKSRKTAKRFFAINVDGTSNLLKGLIKLDKLPKMFVFISTVAVYGISSAKNIIEISPLKGGTPYADSKIEAEKLVWNWGKTNDVKILILRLPLLVGSNPPGNLGAMIKAIKRGYYFRVGDGSARRSMVLADDVARFISTCNYCSGIYNLTDGIHPSIGELDEAIASLYDRRIKVIPYSWAQRIASIGDHLPFAQINSIKLNKLISTLTFSDEKARKELGWEPRPVINNLTF